MLGAMLKRTTHLIPFFSILLIAAFVVAGCAPAPATTSTGTGGGSSSAAATTATTAPTAASAAVTATTATTATTGAATTAVTGTTTTTGTTTAGATTAVTATTATTTTTTTGGPAKNPDTLVYATYGDPESLDPAWEYDTASQQVVLNVYETLLFQKRESATDFVPMLATKWDVSSDGKTYTFTIRKGVKFQLGQDLTPEDVAYSLQRGMIQDRAGGPQWIMLQPFFGLDVQSFKDDVVTKQYKGDWAAATKALQQAITFDNAAGTVTLHLKQPYGPMLQVLTGTWAAVVSKPWVIKQGGWDGTPATAEKFHDPTADKDELFKVMNGTGPFKLDRWAPNEEIDLSRFDGYWVKDALWQGGPTGPAKLARVIIKNVSEWGTRFSMFQAGDADIATVDRQYITQVDPLVKEECDAAGKCAPTTNSGGTLRLFKGLPNVVADAVQFNQAVNVSGGNGALGSGKLDGNGAPANFFSDINVRKAFNYAFDWDTFIKQVWNGEAVQALGPIIQGELGYDANQAHYTFDLTKAADAFKASTLKSADGKSLWDTGFYLQYVYNTGNDQRRVAGEILKQDLAKINPKFKVAVVDEPWPVFLKDQTASRLALYLLGWQEDFHDPHDWVTPFLASGGTYAGTQGFAKDLQAQLDKLITSGVQTVDSAARAKIYSQLQDLSYQNALDLWIEQPQGRHYEQLWVQGWYYNPAFGTDIYFYPLSKGS
jgi:peptide/nickel transport system substrate-binding protein